MKLTDEESALLELATEDWYGLVEFREEFSIRHSDGTETRGPTAETLKKLLSKGLIQLAYVRHYGLPVRQHGPMRLPDARIIQNDQVDAVLADPEGWQGAATPSDEAVEFTVTELGERVIGDIWKQRRGSS